MNQKQKKHILLIHYHLKAGGVTRVIERQLIAFSQLKTPPKITLLTGSKPHFSIPINLNIKIVVEPKFDYLDTTELSENEIKFDIENYKNIITQNLQERSVVHIHNPTLGKNGVLTAALNSIAKTGTPLFYHCHDFAEERPLMTAQLEAIWLHLSDFKSFNSFLYPNLKNVVYLFANREDMSRSQFKKIDSSNKIYLPNPVAISTYKKMSRKKMSRKKIGEILNIDSSKKWLLYPVRAILRKNIGEFILLSLLFKDKYQWIITAAPENKKELENYKKWVEIATKLSAPVSFNSSKKVEFEEIYDHANLVVTTSYQEGFGMAFLEPWLAGLAVAGRDIKMVTDDFKKVGVKFNNLYQNLFVEKNGEWRDFATLSLEDKFECVIRVGEDEVFRKTILNKNSFLQDIFENIDFDMVENMSENMSENKIENVIEKNRVVVEANFSILSFGKNLIDIYWNR